MDGELLISLYPLQLLASRLLQMTQVLNLSNSDPEPHPEISSGLKELNRHPLEMKLHGLLRQAQDLCLTSHFAQNLPSRTFFF